MKSNCFDLNEIENHIDSHCDICIIGAGAAGIYLATELSKIGKDVILLEAGPSSTVYASEIGFDPVFLKGTYRGGTIGRSFGMGGSTSRWGGLLIPHTDHNAVRKDPFFVVWSSIVVRVNKNLSTVLSRLGYDRHPSFDCFHDSKLESSSLILEKCGLDIQSSLYIPFRRKNFIGLLRNVSDSSGPRIFFNAVTKDWISSIDSSGMLCFQKLEAVSGHGKRISIYAKKYIIAAGAIESARILLEIRKKNGIHTMNHTSAIGNYLSDHLSIPIANVAPADFSKTRKLFAPYFEGEWMRGFRFLFKSTRNEKPLFFTHFIFAHDSAGFKLAKEILGSIQERRLPSISFYEILNGMYGLSRIAYKRLISSRLHVPASTPIYFQLDMEQHRVRENRVFLSSDLDEYGRNKVVIEWQISKQDLQSIQERASQCIDLWPGNKYGLPDLIPRPIDKDINKPYDAYHPVGTCTMGEDSESVVDMNLKVWGTDNLWVVSTGVLPTAGSANPTFTMLCLAHDLVDRLSN